MTDEQNNSPIKPSVSRLPSQETDVPWLGAKRRKGTYPETSNRSGKWLIFVPREQIDNIWLTIKEATEEGILGSAAKVSTALSNPNSTEPNKNVICVYTYDSDDEQDVRRIREELRKMWITEKIPYKPDEATRSGQYRVRGHENISKYWK